MPTFRPDVAINIITANANRFTTLIFQKLDGTKRVLNGFINPRLRSRTLTIKDVNVKGFRSVRLDGICQIRVRGRIFSPLENGLLDTKVINDNLDAEIATD